MGKYRGLLDLLADDGLTFRERMANLSSGQVGSILEARGPRQKPFAEHYFTMVGSREEDGSYLVSLIDNQSQGNPGMVEFDWQAVIDRHVQHRDVVGLFHTHPPGAHYMSEMDARTFTSWVVALGGPRYAVILCEGLVHAWRLTLDGVRLKADKRDAEILEDGRIRIEETP